jgi:alpha-amylase
MIVESLTERHVRTKYGTKVTVGHAVKLRMMQGFESIYADIVVNHLGGADEAEKNIVKRVNPDNRNEFIQVMHLK